MYQCDILLSIKVLLLLTVLTLTIGDLDRQDYFFTFNLTIQVLLAHLLYINDKFSLNTMVWRAGWNYLNQIQKPLLTQNKISPPKQLTHFSGCRTPISLKQLDLERIV